MSDKPYRDKAGIVQLSFYYRIHIVNIHLIMKFLDSR